MNWLDYSVLFGAIGLIVAYGLWKTRAQGDLGQYLKGDASIQWGTIGISVMATQASAITFLSTPGQAYESGLGFVQNYFGLPLALLVVCAFFLPIYRRLGVFTAYEYLGQRFDKKTRLLGAFLFLVQRGLATGITIYAPAIIITALVGWNLDLTILLAGGLVILYTASGGTKAVSLTQRAQMGVILCGMVLAFGMIVWKLPADLSFGQAVAIAGKMGKLRAVDFSLDLQARYTFWSGLFGGFFLALAYFGADQSQVQRYLAGDSVAASRFGLIFNAMLKVPMQFGILFLGAMVFLFYQFEKPPIFFNVPVYQSAAKAGFGSELAALEKEYDAVFTQKQTGIRVLTAALATGDAATIQTTQKTVLGQDAQVQSIRARVKAVLKRANTRFESKDSDYVFLTFILRHLPHGVIGLLLATIFCAAMSAAAASLNALGSTSVVDFYRPLIRPQASDAHYVLASKLLTVFWGIVAIGFALFANLVENLIEAGNILGSLFYGSILGLFLVAFFLPRVRGSAVFSAGLVAQTLVLILYATTSIGYLWYNVIGCATVAGVSGVLQSTIFRSREPS